MKITYNGGVFYCDAPPSARALADNKWQWLDDIWATKKPERVVPLEIFCSPAAKKKLARWRDGLMAEIEDSFKPTSDFQVPAPEGRAYYEYQRGGVDFIHKHKGNVLLADPPGLGKTCQAIGYSNLPMVRAHRILIVVPATLKANWQREWLFWDTKHRSVGIAYSRVRSKTENGERIVWREDIWPDTDVVIVNYEQFEKYNTQIKEIAWDLVICDEADRFGNTKSKAHVFFFGGKYKKKIGSKTLQVKIGPVQGRKIIYINGTPIPKSPIQMWPIIRSCDPRDLGRDWMAFTKRYCEGHDGPFGWDATGASNLEELQYKMRAAFMVRRDKLEVLDLPPKTREIVILPKEGLTKQIERELSVARQGIFEFEKMMGLPVNEHEEVSEDEMGAFMEAYFNRYRGTDEERAAALDTSNLELAFEEFSEARSALSLAKIPMLCDRIDRALNEHDCLVFFGVHTSFIDQLSKRYDNMSVRITGSTPVKRRQEYVDTFQNDKDCRIIFGNIRAMGVGVTLTRARLNMFGELEWNPNLVVQAEDRIWRIGQTNACLIQQMIVEGSLDANFIEKNIKKQEIADRALDAKRLDLSQIFVESNSNFL